MRKLVIILIAFIAVVTFIRAIDYAGAGEDRSTAVVSTELES